MLMVTASPEVELAVGVYVPSFTGFDGIAEVNEIDWFAFLTVTVMVLLDAAR